MHPDSTPNDPHPVDPSRKSPRAAGAEYALACLASVGIAAWVLRLWNASPSVPLRWRGDGILMGILVKAMLESGWYTRTPFLGAPDEFNFNDYPMSDGLNFLLIKLFAAIGGNFAVAINLHYVLGFPMVAAASLWVLRRRGISPGPAIAISVLYSLLPAHFLRGIAHLFYAGYYSVPLATELMLSLADPEPPLLWRGAEGRRPSPGAWVRRNLPTFLLATIVASSGVYMAFFACFLLIVAGLFAAATQWSRRPLISMALLVALVSALVALNLAPAAAYRWRHGPNPEGPRRTHTHAETYGLKLAQLALPIAQHRVPALAKLRAKYDKTVLVNENGMASLGAVGTFGLIWLLTVLLFGRRRGARLDLLATLTGAAVLLATTGGLGSLFALTVSPLIRGYNRISTYIGFFSLLTVAILLDRLSARFATSRARPWITAGPAALLLLGALDQTSPRWVPPYAPYRQQFEAERAYTESIERSLDSGAMVFQLPYFYFPEHGPLQRMDDYDPARLYAHSKTLRWSYGAMRGRKTDLWQRRVSTQPVPQLLREICAAGFDALLVDRSGYEDAAAELEKRLRAELDKAPLASADRRYAFYDLRPYRASLATTEGTRSGGAVP